MEAEDRDGSLPAATAAEEAMKRNTDCVYFLASPLTCKKGVECEYRHSEGARMNPRDCWYWLNGNCSNPKCAFRHPPLDGILGTPGIGIPSQAPALRMSLPYPPASHNSNKQGIPCYYFQMGACMKGDMCSFMHGPPELKKTNHVTQQTPRVGVHDSISPHIVTPSCLGKVEQQNIPTVKSERLVEVVPFSHESVCKAERFQGNGFAIKSDARVDTDNFTKSNASSIPGSIGNTLSRVRSHHSEDTDEGLIDDGEADEFLHESSPGFDVLVDDDTEDPTYFLGEEEFQDGSCYENNMNAASDFGRYKVSDSDAATRYERGQYHEIAEYGQYMHAHDHYGQEFHEASTEGVIGRPSMSNRRSRRAEPPTEINGSDLRYQLLKKRKLRGLRSISPGRKDAYRRDDRYARGNDGHVHGPGLHREKGHIYRQGTVSKRLEGRISVANHGDLYCNRDFDRERSWGNSFSRKPTDSWGRFENRINWGKHREDVSEERKHAARSTRKDGDGLEFDGPKSFSELRGAKISGRQRQRSNGDSDYAFHSTLEKNTRSDKQLLDLENESCSFEGPKPLSMILKRKREATLQGCTSADCDAKVLQDSDFMVSHPTNGEEQRHAQSSLQSETLEMEDPDFENYAEEGEAEHEYEEDDGGEFAPKNDEVEEYDNTYQDDEEYVDGEDGDEFAQKLGVMYS